MLRIVDTFGDVLPDSCLSSCREAWSILDALLAKFGSQYDITERTTRVIRGGLRRSTSAASVYSGLRALRWLRLAPQVQGVATKAQDNTAGLI